MACFSGFEILGVFMDIAGRRLSIRATETDTNEGVLVFFFWFGGAAHFPLFLCLICPNWWGV